MPPLLLPVQGRFSPAWEMIKAPRHIWLMLLNFHSVTCYEVRGGERGGFVRRLPG